MKCSLWIITLTALAIAGCGQDKPPAASGDTQNTPSLTSPTPNPAQGTDAAAPTDATGMSMPVPPPGAQYSLLCMGFSTPTHIADANRTKQMLADRTRLKGWYVINTAVESDLYYGFYTTFDDPRQPDEVARAKADLAKMQDLADDQGDKLFAQVAFVAINTPDPPAPREWDLANCKGYWTLQVLVYKDSPLRKQAAVDSVRDARAQGVEAYFHHGEMSSEVCIGSWPKEAVKSQEAASASNSDPHQPLLILPAPIEGMEGKKVYNRQGEEYKVVVPKLEILDPTLKKAIADYPYTVVNGKLMGHKVRQADHTESVVPDPSYLIQVPHDGQDMPRVDDAAGPGNEPTPLPLPDDGSLGHLKSIGQ